MRFRTKNRRYREFCLRYLLIVQANRCFYCQTWLAKPPPPHETPDPPPPSWGANHATIDHLIPRSRRGTDHLNNLCLACRRCNEAKGDMTVVEFIGSEYFAGL